MLDECLSGEDFPLWKYLNIERLSGFGVFRWMSQDARM